MGKIRYKTELTEYYLNHVGYKEIGNEGEDKEIDFVLSEPCGI